MTATQTAIKSEIATMAATFAVHGVKPDYSELTRRAYRNAGVLEAYEIHKASGLKASFISTLLG